MKYVINLLLFSLTVMVYGQAKPSDAYYQLPENPKEYTAGTVAGRIVDGLGFRYYWATDGLTKQDLAFRPSEGARSIEETVDHILSLTDVLLNAVNERPSKGVAMDGLTFQEKRNQTLENILNASRLLKESSEEDLTRFNMVFSETVQYPFWNMLNGPIADAINHVGQIITLRRTNGNPINQNISVLQGTVKN